MFFLKQSDPDFNAKFEKILMLRAEKEKNADVEAKVDAIIDRVIREGDAALYDLTLRFDGADFRKEGFAVSKKEREEAWNTCPPATIAALETAAERVRVFHERQKPEDVFFTDALGVGMGWRWTPLASVGLYVPGGTAAYPSSVLMNGVPAKVAGVKRLVMTTPASGGVINPSLLVAADLAEVDVVLRLGGAQAVAALAYGAETVQTVDKIVGPGNAYVAAAKRKVFGKIGVDMVAGPSEVLILADETASCDWIAADLLAQAEHDPLAQSILITSCAVLAEKTARAVEAQMQALTRCAIAKKSWEDLGVIIWVEHLEAAVALIDRVAPEHLEIHTRNPERDARRITNAGAIFLGAATPEAIGDYVGGPSHVLPTSQSARFSSGLGTIDFMKRTSLLRCPEILAPELAEAAITLAEAEGLTGHANAVKIRQRPSQE